METTHDAILYSRPGCHLCERAARMLDAAGARWREVDIDGDAELAERYGLVIPVVRRPGSGRELAFPFDAEALAEFLAA
jgi:hypothetical protein